MKTLLTALALTLLAANAEAATRYASASGSGTTCSEGSPCTLATMVGQLVAGDIGIINAGTYTGNITVTNRNGTSANPITLRAANYAVSCADPVNAPDDCVVANIGSRSNLNLQFRLANSDFWHIEGVQLRDFYCDNGSSDGRLRFFHLYSEANITGTLDPGCNNVVIEHGYITKEVDVGGDYGFRTFWTVGVTFNNLYIAGGNFHHMISLKRGDRDMTIERIVCEGWEAQCIILGQENDDNQFSSSSSTSCSGVTLDNGATGNITDQTVQNITVRNVFGRNATQTGTTILTRSLIQIGNARNVTIENILGKVGGHADPVPIWIRNLGTDGFPGGRCGVERGNITIRGAILIGTGSVGGCIRVSTLGEIPATHTFDQIVCHGADDEGDNGIVWGSNQLGNAAAWESTLRPAMIIRNSVFNDCVSAWADSHGAVSLTQSHNNFFNCGTSKGGTGAQTVDPAFTGPESVPIPALPNSHTGGKWANGARLWDWAGEYGPIMARFTTNEAGNSFENAGTGTASPCVGTCDIGANEWLSIEIPTDVWASCAVVADDAPVHGDGTIATPWLDDRTGLTVDIDCARKEIVIGRCDDPLDEGTCDTDIYIRKQAYKQVKRVQEAIDLSAGTTGSDADTSGVCWRTRATHTFTESLDELTGVWVHVQVDPDGGTHDCSASTPSPYWAWQAAD